MLKIKRGQPLAQVAPLLCAGSTTYSPPKRYKTRKGSKVKVIGLGGLGHIAVKLPAAMGAEVTVFSTSATKQQDAVRLGAAHFVLTSQPEHFEPWAARLDLIIDTVSEAYTGTIKGLAKYRFVIDAQTFGAQA